MSANAWFAVIVGALLAVTSVLRAIDRARERGVVEGRAAERAALRQNAVFAQTIVNDDGCLGVGMTDGVHREFANEPHCVDRRGSRDLACQILQRQGEEGAVAAESILRNYVRREVRLAGDEKVYASEKT